MVGAEAEAGVEGPMAVPRLLMLGGVLVVRLANERIRVPLEVGIGSRIDEEGEDRAVMASTEGQGQHQGRPVVIQAGI